MKHPLRFHFILPFSGRKPVGGFKVVYEYANELVRRGHEVQITHAAGLYLGVNSNDRVWINLAKFLIFSLLRNYRPDRWFTLEPAVKTRLRPSLHPIFMPVADYVIATSWETVEWISGYSGKKGEPVYLIQHLEDWHAPKARVLGTWRAIHKKIVISRWLGAIAEELGETSSYIPNGLDFNRFGMDVKPEDRNSASVLMLHHDQAFKGTDYGLKALERARKVMPELRVTCFGAQEPTPHSLPDWVHFELRPTPSRLRELYNQHAIFISPSLSEGWALPPAEAMQCGCATVLTEIGGHEYARDGITSLLCPIQTPDVMARKVLELIEDPEKRVKLARNGHKEIAQYTWPLATDRFLEAIATRKNNT